MNSIHAGYGTVPENAVRGANLNLSAPRAVNNEYFCTDFDQPQIALEEAEEWY